MCLIMTIRPTTHDAILEAGYRLLSSNSGASMADIAEAAGVGRATLHRHFATREDLMSALAKRALKELSQAIETATKDAPSYTEGLRLALEAVIPLADRQAFLTLEAADHDIDIARAYEQERKETAAAFDAAKFEGSFAKDIPAEWMVAMYDAVIDAAWTLVRAEDATPKQAAKFAWRMLTAGLSGDADDR